MCVKSCVEAFLVVINMKFMLTIFPPSQTANQF